jgi:hypothetical protein
MVRGDQLSELACNRGALEVDFCSEVVETLSIDLRRRLSACHFRATRGCTASIGNAAASSERLAQGE